MDPNQTFTILSFVGGGIRGLMSATILQRLSQPPYDTLINQTTMLAGCSTGAIISSELLAGTTPQGLIELFTGSEIGFYNNMNDKPDAPAYPMIDVLYSQEQLHGDTPVSQAAKDVLLVSFNVGALKTNPDGRVVPKPWDPIMFTNLLGTEQDRQSGLDGNSSTPIAIAACSSGAMPGQLGSVEGNVDGAFFNHDPTLAAICLAVHNGVPLEKIVAITIGTGLMPDWLASDTTNWGAKQWMNGDANPFDNTPPFLMNQTQPSPILDMCLSGTSANMMPRLCKMLLGDRYVNINPRLPCFIPENSTSPQAINLLQRHGESGDPENFEKAQALLRDYWPNSRPPIHTTISPPPNTGGVKTPASVPSRPKAATANAAPGATPGHGEFFFIQHKESGLVLDVYKEATAPGTPVIFYEKHKAPHSLANQLWQFVPSEENPGWWYLQAQLSSDIVLTLADAPVPTPAPVITMEKKDPAGKPSQLWSLISTEELGWWFIQCKAKFARVHLTNPDAISPFVIGRGSSGQPDPIAVGVTLDYAADEPMSWGFMRAPDAQ